jgi:predicted Zn-dependent peptidase
VGWPSDIPAITKAQADEFYSLYYAPQNITLILVGDFKVSEAQTTANRYFGRIPKGKSEAPDVITSEVQQVAEKRMNAEAETNPQVDIVWHTVPFGHKDSYALNILAQVLSTRTGRLYKGLVMGTQVATDVSAGPQHRKWAGLFNVSGEAKEGHTPEEVEQGIYAELEKLKQEEVPPKELQKVKNNFAAYEYRRLTSNMSILMQLIHNDGLGDWREINEAGRKHQAVTAADIRRVANEYLFKENRTVGIYLRKTGASSADPALKNLSPTQRDALRTLATRLKEEKDVERLKQALQSLQTQADKADEKARPLLEAQKQLLQHRLEELK